MIPNDSLFTCSIKPEKHILPINIQLGRVRNTNYIITKKYVPEGNVAIMQHLRTIKLRTKQTTRH